MADGVIRAYDPNAPLIKETKKTGLLDEMVNKIKVATGELIPSSADDGVLYPDDETAAQARTITEHFEAQQSQREGTFKHDVVPKPSTPPLTPEQAQMEPVRNFTNFLFGDTAAAVGVTWERDGIHASLDTMRDMWSDHPYRAGLSLAADAGPMFAAGLRVARSLRGVSADIDAGELVAKGLANSVADYDKLDTGAKAIVQGQAKRIAELTQLRSAVDSGTANPIQKIKYAFQEGFGNSYLESQTLNETNPEVAIKEWHEKTKNILSGKSVQTMLDLADDVKPTEGTAILHAIKDPTQLNSLSPKARELALSFSSEGRELQKQALAEGFIDQDAVDKVGDVWFSTLRQDSPLFEEGAKTEALSLIRKKDGAIRTISVPRTGSPSLKARGLDQSGVTDLIKRQRAAEALDAGNKEKAIKHLAGTADEQEAVGLIRSGDLDNAKKLLGKEGFIASNPKELVVRSLIQQKLLLENFRTLRDVALNPTITKTAEEVAAMSKATRRRMMSLDKIQNAGVLRRMVETKSGKRIANLGFIDESLFHEVARVADHGTTNQFVSLLEFATAIHKTAKTALNPFTHIQNLAGNHIFMWLAGMNPADPQNYALAKQSWSSFRDFQAARKAGTPLEKIADLGKVKGLDGKDIDIAEEIMSPILSGRNGLLDISSMEAAEGIPILARMYEKAGDHQLFIKKAIEYTQKASKVGPKGLTAEAMSSMYMAEDSAAKLTYYLHLRQRGLSPLASANEVAKRLPMYGTLGHTLGSARKAAVPWISFPAETIRIMKNNMIDAPLRTAMVMQIPDVLQMGMAMGPQAFGQPGMSYEETRSRQEQLPMWAQKASAVVAPPLLTDPFTQERNQGQVRSFMLDVLPWMSIPGADAPDASWQEKMPMGLGNLFPIISGFKDALEGKGRFGQDVATDPNSITAKVGTILLRTMGTLAPPMVEKYLMNPELPTVYYRAQVDAGYRDNPSTGETGTPFFDLLVNNSFIKSYAGGPEMQVANQRFSDRRIEAYRGRLGKELRAFASTGDWTNVVDTLRSVQATYLKDSPDKPALARKRYKDWLKLHAREIMKHPSFKGMSKADFVRKLQDEESTEFQKMDPARREYIAALREGYRQSGKRKKRGTGNPLTSATRPENE